MNGLFRKSPDAWRMSGLPCVRVKRDARCVAHYQPIIELKDDGAYSRVRHYAWKCWIEATAREGFDV